MSNEMPKINREKTDWDYARQVRTLMQKGKTFHQACDQVLANLGIENFQSRLAWKKRIGKICADISAKVREKPVIIMEEKSVASAPYEDFFTESRRLRREKALKDYPLFTDQINEEFDLEEKKRKF